MFFWVLLGIINLAGAYLEFFVPPFTTASNFFGCLSLVVALACFYMAYDS